MTDVQKTPGRRNNGLILWVLIAAFALPTVCSWALILNPDLLPQSRSNHGVLIQPAVALPALSPDSSDSTGFRPEELHGKWTFLMVVDGVCAGDCRELVHQLQQIRRATGKDMTHVGLVVLYTDGQVSGDGPVITETSGMIVTGLNSTEKSIMAAALQQAGVLERPGLVVIDPMGNMVLRYPQAVAGKEILQDLRRLLRATHDWLPGEGEA